MNKENERVVQAGGKSNPRHEKKRSLDISVPSVLRVASSGQSYKLQRQIGKGGFSRVFSAVDEATGEEWAIKVVPKKSLVKAKTKAKLRSEIKIHASMRHPNICRFQHYFDDDENVYIVLELCSNQTLMELVKRKGRLSETVTRNLLRQTLLAIEYMHRNLVIHRDLKLGNIFMSSPDEVKLGDFGLAARLEDSEERKRTMCGTPNYIAPEILSPEDGHSFEVDVWAFGVVMFSMLTGKPPFETQDIKTTYSLIRKCSFRYPDDANLSPEATSLINRLLTSNPQSRPTLKEIWDAPFFADSPAAPVHIASSVPAFHQSMATLAINDSDSTTPFADADQLLTRPRVLHYLDYSSKYGVGYLLSNRCVGAYFNDATVMVMSPDQKEVAYLDRGAPDTEMRVFQPQDGPDDLTKKTKLINYFAACLQKERSKLAQPEQAPANDQWRTGLVRKLNNGGDKMCFVFSDLVQVKFGSDNDLLFALGDGRVTNVGRVVGATEQVVPPSMLSDREIRYVRACAPVSLCNRLVVD